MHVSRYRLQDVFNVKDGICLVCGGETKQALKNDLS